MKKATAKATATEATAKATATEATATEATAKATATEATATEAKVEVFTTTLETLKGDLLILRDSERIAENNGGVFLRNVIRAQLTLGELKELFTALKDTLSASYAKKMAGAINIAYTLQIGSEKMAILETKGFNNAYAQLREWKQGTKAIVDNVQTIKTKGESVTQRRTNREEAKKDESNATEAKANHLENAIVKSATLSDVMDLLTSLADMAKNAKDNPKVLEFLASHLLKLEDETYDMTA